MLLTLYLTMHETGGSILAFGTSLITNFQEILIFSLFSVIVADMSSIDTSSS